MSGKASTPLRLLLIDRSKLVRLGVKSALGASSTPPITVVGEAGSVAAAVSAWQRLKPQVVLLGGDLPDGSGFAVCRQVLPQLPESRVILLAARTSDELVYEAVAAGAHGFLTTDAEPAELVRAIREVAAGRSILDPDSTRRVMRLLRAGGAEKAADLSSLSAQERRVLALVADGLTNKQAGRRLGLSENTVKNYLVSVFEKLQVKRRAQAAALYVQQAGANRD